MGYYLPFGDFLDVNLTGTIIQMEAMVSDGTVIINLGINFLAI